MKLLKYVSAAVLLLTAGLGADCDHNTYKTNNFMIPVGRVVFNPEFDNSNFAVSGIGEIGVRNYRASLTGGLWTTERTRLKVTGEYLTQKLGWNFSTGRQDHWVHQGAGGFDWQYLMDDCSIFQAFDLKGYYSYSGSKNLNDGICAAPGAAVVAIGRHLAGANAIGGSFNTVMTFGDSHRLDVSLDYDHVNYRRKFSSDKKVHGLGGSFLWVTRLPCCMDFSLEGQFRRPFNYFGARLSWNEVFASKNTNVALFAGWTRGKCTLPHSLKVGVELVYNFNLGSSCCEKPKQDCCAPLWNPCNLNAWTLVPAVYMPEVLVIRDECSSGGIVSQGIPDNTYIPEVLYSLNTALFFNSPNTLTYAATGLPAGVTIDSNTGIISGVISGLDTYNITVTASTSCATASASYILSPGFIP